MKSGNSLPRYSTEVKRAMSVYDMIQQLVNRGDETPTFSKHFWTHVEQRQRHSLTHLGSYCQPSRVFPPSPRQPPPPPPRPWRRSFRSRHASSRARCCWPWCWKMLVMVLMVPGFWGRRNLSLNAATSCWRVRRIR